MLDYEVSIDGMKLDAESFRQVCLSQETGEALYGACCVIADAANGAWEGFLRGSSRKHIAGGFTAHSHTLKNTKVGTVVTNNRAAASVLRQHPELLGL